MPLSPLGFASGAAGGAQGAMAAGGARGRAGRGRSVPGRAVAAIGGVPSGSLRFRVVFVWCRAMLPLLRRALGAAASWRGTRRCSLGACCSYRLRNAREWVPPPSLMGGTGAPYSLAWGELGSTPNPFAVPARFLAPLRAAPALPQPRWGLPGRAGSARSPLPAVPVSRPWAPQGFASLCLRFLRWSIRKWQWWWQEAAVVLWEDILVPRCCLTCVWWPCAGR